MLEWQKSVIDDNMDVDEPYYDESEYLVTYKELSQTGTEEAQEHQCIIYARTSREAQGKARLILKHSKGKYIFISVKINGIRKYNRGNGKTL